MNLHSTFDSYLQRLVWLFTGHYRRPGISNAFVPSLSLPKVGKGDTSMGKKGASRVERRSLVVDIKIIIDLIPCNMVPEEISTDHPKCYCIMLVETGNPLYSPADSRRMHEVMRVPRLSVVIDVVMAETTRHADYVLPATSQFEEAKATFFNLEFLRNAFHLRTPLSPACPGTLSEVETHTRLLGTMDILGEKDYRSLRLALRLRHRVFSAVFLAAAATRPKVMKYAPVLLYHTPGLTLLVDMEAATAIWGICQLHVLSNRKTAARAGFDGLPSLAADRPFRTMLGNPSGMVSAETICAESWQAVTRPEQQANLHIPELLPELAKLAHSAPSHDPVYPFILAAGEWRSDTSNTAVRDIDWHRRGRYGTPRINPQDAEALGCADGEVLRVVTCYGDIETEVEISDMMQPGNVSLPNGQGLDYRNTEGGMVRRDVAPNEVTDCTQRDFLAGAPRHKYVPTHPEQLAMLVATNI